MKYLPCLFVITCLFFSLILPAQTAHTYRILSLEREALQCRLDLIHQARKEIRMSTYAIKDDVIGLATLQMLIEAAGRGVSVQLLVDDFDNGLPDCLLSYLQERG